MTAPQDLTLNNGVTMPQLGLGVWRVSDDEAERAVTTAIKAGYRSIDTAALYYNEIGVGRAVRASDVPREDMFITTKLWNSDHGYDRALRAFQQSLDRLGLEYLDLYLIHWPVPRQDEYLASWHAMEKLLADGLVRAIGVSNFTTETLSRLLNEGNVLPAVNQIELHPRFAQAELRAFGQRHDILTEAWSPLGQGKGLLNDPVLGRLAAAHGRTPAQIVLRWHIQLGNLVIPKSVHADRIAENIDVFNFALTESDMEAIATLDDPGGRIGPDPAIFG